MRGAMVGSATGEAPGSSAEGSTTPGVSVLTVEDEVVRDLRHSVGNYFHKLYYWADRIASEDDGTARAELQEELNGALQRFQEFLEVGLRYFQPDVASPIAMPAADIASASEALLRNELPGCAVAVDIDPGARDLAVSVDPQRFSQALRIVVDVLGGAARETFGCAISLADDGEAVEFTIEATGGEAPVEMPVMQWAIARKAISMQGGTLEPSSGQDEAVGGCTMRLPIGS